MVTKSARSVALKITITPELHARLRALAAELGQAPATVASLAIGQYVASTSRAFGAGERMVDAMAKEAGPAMVEQMKIALGGKS
jgi:predicted DNA-binding protein